MPPERFPPADPREWLNRARSNLAQARRHVGEIQLEDLCFAAQQAAEKAIKAVLINRRVGFPYVHDLARLLTLAEEAGARIPEAVRRGEVFTRYALITRYPGLAEPVTETQYQEAAATAEAVVRWAQETIA